MDNNQLLIFSRISQIVNQKLSGAVVLPSNPSIDATASATALYLSLLKLGKNISLSCSTKVDYDLTAVDKIQKNLSASGDSLMISFPYTDGSIDKIDYRIEGESFNLIITPRNGFPKLDPSKVSYSYTGGKLDFIFVLDSPTLTSLGELYQNNQNQFQGLEIINIDRHLTNANFGTINYVNKTASSLSEMVFLLIKNLGVELDKDIATNLYAGLASATNNFSSYSVNAQTFETAAALLKMGAIKKIIKKPSEAARINTFTPPSFTPKPFEVKPIESVEKEPKPAKSQETPDDWLKPKIFKGGGLI
jgi:nanoRNase/pAp phosphatase (c-di-AMP/oligoRNAs hydrolase)